MAEHKDRSHQLIFGRRPVEEFLKTAPRFDHVQEVFLNPGMAVRLGARLKALLSSVPVHYLSHRDLDELFPEIHHQGVVIKSRPGRSFLRTDISSWQEHIRRTGGLLLLLDSIQDPSNLGSIIRSAEAMGVQALFITGKGAALNETVHRTSAGASLHLPVFSLANLHQLIQVLKKMGFWICSSGSPERKQRELSGKGLAVHKGLLWLEHSQVQALPPTEKLALVIGHEGRGIKPLILKESDFLLSIALGGTTASLNAGVAAGIIIDRLIHRKAMPGAPVRVP